MGRNWMYCPLLLVLFSLAPAPGYAQDEEAEARDRQEAQEAEARREQEAQRIQADIDRGQAALRAFIHDNGSNSPGRTISPSAELAARFRDFRLAIPKFRTATSDYRWALSTDAKLDKTLKGIEDQIDVLLRYFSAAKKKHPRLDATEFKDYSQNELAWETLNSAERIAPYLDVAVQVEQQDVVAPKMMEFMYQLDGELMRLKWLAGHTKG